MLILCLTLIGSVVLCACWLEYRIREAQRIHEEFLVKSMKWLHQWREDAQVLQAEAEEWYERAEVLVADFGRLPTIMITDKGHEA